ncbi:hypothetical protein JEQ12_020246 [Ovis aries]|uniref:Uncharacterized protein n=1 Tax=Ovis aries TaxID=9940 RepID=A0A836CPA4_SHEEP|nr:hypothetical protein JEQ12_020246 [Ovis aries]
MAAKKSCNAVCFKDERKKEDPLLMEIQRQCEGTKNDHEVQKTSTRNPEKENLIICHSVEEGNQEATAAKKTCSAVCFEEERKKEDPLATEIQRQREGTKYDHEGQKTSKRNLEKENPIARHSVEEGNQEATAAKKTCSAVCFEEERKKEDPLATEIQRQREGTKYDHEGQKTSKRNLEKENPIARHSVEEGTKYDHEGQKTSKRNLEKENPIVRHSVEEGEENKRTKLFSPFPCTRETEPKPKEVPKYESESTKGAESKEKISSATPE